MSYVQTLQARDLSSTVLDMDQSSYFEGLDGSRFGVKWDEGACAKSYMLYRNHGMAAAVALKFLLLPSFDTGAFAWSEYQVSFNDFQSDASLWQGPFRSA